MVMETHGNSCHVCNRFHDDNQPCPMRIAKAYTEATENNLDLLTPEDRQWMGKHKDFNCTLELEEIIAHMME